MSTSLRDQLLKAGLVSEDKVRQLERQQEQQRRQPKQKKGVAPPLSAQQAAAQQAQAAKAARDRELNRRQQEDAQRKALRAQVEQLIEQARLPRLESDDFYAFVDGRKIRRLAVDTARRGAITRSELVIVRYKGHHEVVPAEAARAIAERDPTVLVKLKDEVASVPADDPYKDYVVPDDLTW
jgi:uncharacterized protein